jgi:hypothetical protein
MKLVIKIAVLYGLSIGIVNAGSSEEVRLKIERALACNARVTSVSEVQIATLEKSTQYKGYYYVEGIYKSVASFNKKIMGFGVDGFNAGSGSFEALVDSNLKVKKIHWKLGMAQGYVKGSCLLNKQRRF